MIIILNDSEYNTNMRSITTLSIWVSFSLFMKLIPVITLNGRKEGNVLINDALNTF